MASKYTNEDILREYKNANSIADLLRKLGLKQAGGSHSIIKRKLIELGINPDDIKNKSGKGCSKKIPERISDKDVFCNPTKYKSPSKVKKRALKAGYVTNKCAICGQEPYWNKKELVMILDHIDGNNKNNLPENLRIVCPNCDIQLPTSRGKNR